MRIRRTENNAKNRNPVSNDRFLSRCFDQFLEFPPTRNWLIPTWRFFLSKIARLRRFLFLLKNDFAPIPIRGRFYGITRISEMGRFPWAIIYRCAHVGIQRSHDRCAFHVYVVDSEKIGNRHFWQFLALSGSECSVEDFSRGKLLRLKTGVKREKWVGFQAKIARSVGNIVTVWFIIGVPMLLACILSIGDQ